VADKNKTSDKQAISPDAVEDAIVLGPSDAQAQPDKDQDPLATETTDPASMVDGTKTQDAATDPATQSSDPQRPQADQSDPQMTDTPDKEAEVTPDNAPHRPEPPAPPSEKVIIRKGGFLPMLLGGVAAAAIGFGIAYSGAIDGLPLPGLSGAQDEITALGQQITAQDSTISDLTSRLTALEEAPAPEMPAAEDLSPVIADLSAQIAALTRRLDAVEARPAAQGNAVDAATQAALAAATAELDQIRQALDAQRAEIATLADAAAQEEAAARQSAERVMQRAALTRIQTAIDTGTPFAEAVAELRNNGVDVPAPLAAQAESGVTSLAALQSSFPDLARDALRAARQQNGTTGIGGFLETQLGLRSLEPRDGDDPDAVLSRAEAALRSGDLTQTLTELDALPDPAKEVLANWRAQAETRMAAASAAQDLSQALNTN
jgi:hypothetical protein